MTTKNVYQVSDLLISKLSKRCVTEEDDRDHDNEEDTDVDGDGIIVWGLKRSDVFKQRLLVYQDRQQQSPE